MSIVTGEVSTDPSSRSGSQLSSLNAPPQPQTSVVANGGQVNPPASSDLSQAGSNDSSNAAQISRTALIGIIAGSAGFVVLVVVLALIFLLRRRRKRRRAQPAAADSSSESEENQVAQKKPPTLRGPSQDQPPRRSTGDGHVYEAVGYGTNNTALLSAAPTYYHDKDVSSEATTPNQRHSVTLENEETKEAAPLDIDPFSSGYIPPPSPTPSEYVIIDHTTEPEQPLPPRTSRDKRESHVSLLDTIVHEEETNGFATLDSLTSQRASTLGHQRTRSGDASGSGTTTPPPKRPSNRLQKPRPSIESTSSLFLRSTSPTSPASLRNRTPIVFPRDPFEASVEEEPTSAISGPRISLERPARSSYEMKEIDSQSTNKPSVSARPSLDTIAAGAAPADRPSYSRKRSHIRSPSSPTRIPNSPSFLGIGSVRRIGGSSSVLSLQNIHDYDNPSANAPYMNSATMADASVYDFDIYREPTADKQAAAAAATSPFAQSHPPPASAARLSAALNAADVYGSGSSRKRFSASMSDLPIIPASPLPDAVRFPTSASTTNVNLHGKETTATTTEPKKHESTINLYIPKESLDLPP
ncbi:hypothetical protein M408DRAFT_332013 [Serendipita vermifera MAFF 305830]|uniref:Uncharacterized protein n=2 Tax=Serendipita vermifera MAFF 305830 TaxID=933852 RepID=A0A0C3AXH5_SERVB|nr:hypothetical protein M408DRAFT_332013 [Serendipita vermifera MAFF 305830]